MAEGPEWRTAVRRRFATESFDVAIVGGGITGAGIARDAALRGLRVALVEARDFAGGTSSRSSRLVHGGVRYLEHGHLHLVFESSRERHILMRIAPHLVRPLAFTWPVYRGARISRLKLRFGLGLYDALSAFRNVARHESLSREEVIREEPALAADGLLGGARYHDASTDDARLTLANVVSAAEVGAAVMNYVRVVGLELGAGKARGLRVVDGEAGDEFVVRADTIVNATGPWSDDFRALEAPVTTPAVTGSRGSHIAVGRHRVGNRHAVAMLHPEDGRVLFALPSGDQAIIGTTEVPSPASEREPRARREEVRYLLAAANAYFPAARLTVDDVVSAWAGIRPLSAPLAGGDVGSASREHSIVRGPHGVVHVIGGKLTTYRAMAVEVVDMLTASGSKELTREQPLPGGEKPVGPTFAEAALAVADAGTCERLVMAHGSRWGDVWRMAESRPVLREPVGPEPSPTGAEVLYSVHREMAVTLADILVRRTHVAFQAPDHGMRLAPTVARLVAPLLGWSSYDRDAALARYEEEVTRLFGRD